LSQNARISPVSAAMESLIPNLYRITSLKRI